jgi:hypothetical protein
MRTLKQIREEMEDAILRYAMTRDLSDVDRLARELLEHHEAAVQDQHYAQKTDPTISFMNLNEAA